jgi:hypothetical protein
MARVSTARSTGTRKGAPERVRLRIGNLAKAVLVTGQAYQDPKDALNEFVSNAADEYVEAGLSGERIRVVLRRKGQRPMIAVDDFGRGMSAERLRDVARNLFESSKAGDDRTLGEKAIGMLAFQQLGGRLEIVSRAHDSSDTWCLRLTRGSATAELEKERKRARVSSGTTVYVTDLDPDVSRILTQRKVVDYLRTRRSAALARGDYAIEIIEGRNVEIVTPDKPDGIRLDTPARPTLWGRIEFALYVAPRDGKRRRVAVVGRAGTTIIDDLCELDEFAGPPWDTDQVQGQIVFSGLQQSAGRRAVLRDREAFPVFVDTVRSVEPAVARAAEKVMAEVDEQTTGRMADTIRKLFSRVLKELADLDNPMRSQVSDGTDETAAWLPPVVNGHEPTLLTPPPPEPSTREPWSAPRIDDLLPEANAPIRRPPPPGEQGGDKTRTSELPSVRPDPEPTERRSRFNPADRVVLYNDHHADYLLVKDDEAALLDYLATLVAKEYVLYNNPRAHPDDLAEEMVRMMVRVRRHMPRRR